MNIIIEVISHDEQRYSTVGDWTINHEKQLLNISVSDLGDWRMNFLVAFHEAIEAVLCHNRGITADMVDKFDFEYEKQRDVDDKSEPGDDPLSPYKAEHFFATSLERLMAAELEVDWASYEDAINQLD